MSQALSSQPRVGTQISTPWFVGSAPITQDWGPTDYTGEPEGHGYAHWHAGLDVGLPCGTTLILPHGVAAVAEAFDNPGGYGTALKLHVGSTPPIDIILGHLRQRLVDNGQQLMGGEQLAVSNNTGNSSGCHTHFEVRPKDGQYGSDIDPTGWLLNPNGEGITQPYTSPPGAGQPQTVQTGFGPTDAIGKAIMSFSEMLAAQAQASLGLVLMAVGGFVILMGARGKGVAEAASTAAGPIKNAQAASQASRAAATRQAAEQARDAARVQRQQYQQGVRNRALAARQGRQQQAAYRTQADQFRAHVRRQRVTEAATAQETVLLGGRHVKMNELSPQMQAAVRNARIRGVNPAA